MQVNLDPTQRTGLLTSAAFLAANANPESVVADPAGPFRSRADHAPDDPATAQRPHRSSSRRSPTGTTTRERFSAHHAQAFCASCHQIDQIWSGSPSRASTPSGNGGPWTAGRPSTRRARSSSRTIPSSTARLPAPSIWRRSSAPARRSPAVSPTQWFRWGVGAHGGARGCVLAGDGGQGVHQGELRHAYASARGHDNGCFAAPPGRRRTMNRKTRKPGERVRRVLFPGLPARLPARGRRRGARAPAVQRPRRFRGAGPEHDPAVPEAARDPVFAERHQPRRLLRFGRHDELHARGRS